jgi:hypothetical protein
MDNDFGWRKREIPSIVLGPRVSLDNREREASGVLSFLGRKGGGTYYGDDAVGLQQCLKILQKLEGEEIYGLGAPCEHVMDYIVELVGCLVDQVCCISDCVGNDGRVVGRQLEVFGGKLVHNRVNFDHCRVHAMCNEGCWRGADAEPARFGTINYKCA